MLQITKILLAVTLSFSLGQAALGFDSEADYAILMDYDSNEILYAKNADIAMAPSSMSKLMTIYIIFDEIKNGHLKLTDKFTVSEKAWRKQGSKMFLKLNESVSVQDLLYGIIILSGNDACITIAEGMSGSEEEFSIMANKKARELGLTNSNFTNSTGWPDEQPKMSARDLAILSQRLIKDFPEYYSYFSEREFTFNNIRQENRNSLLGGNVGVDGLKTGHTEIAGYGTTLSAQQNERRLIAVVNGLKSHKERTQAGEKLLRYGFLQFTNEKIFAQKSPVTQIKIKNGVPNLLPAVTLENIIVTLPKNYKGKIKQEIKIDADLNNFPIEKNSLIGIVKLTSDDMEKDFPIYAGETISLAPWYIRLWNYIKELIHIDF